MLIGVQAAFGMTGHERCAYCWASARSHLHGPKSRLPRCHPISKQTFMRSGPKKKRLHNEDDLSEFCGFLGTELGKPLRLVGLQWVVNSIESQNRDARWYRPATGNNLIAFLNVFDLGNIGKRLSATPPLGMHSWHCSRSLSRGKFRASFLFARTCSFFAARENARLELGLSDSSR